MWSGIPNEDEDECEPAQAGPGGVNLSALAVRDSGMPAWDVRSCCSLPLTGAIAWNRLRRFLGVGCLRLLEDAAYLLSAQRLAPLFFRSVRTPYSK